jgi:hypothetical protein
VIEQSAPIALGAAGVAIAAAAVFFMPIPKVPTPPKELQTQPSIGKPVESPAGVPPKAKSGTSIQVPVVSPAAAPKAGTASPQPSPKAPN